MKLSPRRIALEVLHKVEAHNAYARIALDSALSASELPKEDRALVTELVYGVLRRLGTLDWVLDIYSVKRRVEDFPPYIRNILRLGAYQLLFLDRIPAYAAIDEAVEMSKEFGHSGVASLVNALLRTISANKDNIIYPEPEKNLSLHLSIKYSHPQWLVARWLARFGEKETIELCQVNNEPPPLTIRVNTLKTSREELIKILRKEGVEAEEMPLSRQGVRIRNFISLTGLESFQHGLFTVQGEGAQLISQILAPEPGETVLDTCSAPGGKTTHIAEIMQNTGRIVALDIHKARLEMVKENCKRLGVSNVETELLDIRRASEKYAGKFDKCLVDAPCSGLGIIQSQPEIRWRRSPADVLVKMPQLQFEILDSASQCVRPGGVLVYCVCSFEPEEADNVIERFLKQRPLFHLESIKRYLPVPREDVVDADGFLRTYPHRHRMDGMFACRLVKKG